MRSQTRNLLTPQIWSPLLPAVVKPGSAWHGMKGSLTTYSTTPILPSPEDPRVGWDLPVLGQGLRI